MPRSFTWGLLASSCLIIPLGVVWNSISFSAPVTFDWECEKLTSVSLFISSGDL